MSERAKSAKKSKRSEKLRQEALNCVDIAVRENEPGFAAMLIDEALKLSRRAKELGDAAPGSPEKPIMLQKPKDAQEAESKAGLFRGSVDRDSGGVLCDT